MHRVLQASLTLCALVCLLPRCGCAVYYDAYGRPTTPNGGQASSQPERLDLGYASLLRYLLGYGSGGYGSGGYGSAGYSPRAAYGKPDILQQNVAKYGPRFKSAAYDNQESNQNNDAKLTQQPRSALDGSESEVPTSSREFRFFQFPIIPPIPKIPSIPSIPAIPTIPPLPSLPSIPEGSDVFVTIHNHSGNYVKFTSVDFGKDLFRPQYRQPDVFFSKYVKLKDKADALFKVIEAMKAACEKGGTECDREQISLSEKKAQKYNHMAQIYLSMSQKQKKKNKKRLKNALGSSSSSSSSSSESSEAKEKSPTKIDKAEIKEETVPSL